MSLQAGRWTGPILDNHFHLDRDCRFLAAAEDFKRVGGTHLVLVHKPAFDDGVPTDLDGYRTAYDETISMATVVRRELQLNVRVVLGPHPAVWAHQCEPLGIDGASELHLEAVQLALEYCAEGEAVAVGEVGRPHWDVGEQMWQVANQLLAEVLTMCKQQSVPVQLHLDGGGKSTYGEIAEMCDSVGMPRYCAIHHHAQADIGESFTHGLIPSVIVGRGSIEKIVETLADSRTGFLMETDYMDDPKRPGAVLGPKTVPKRTQSLIEPLIESGFDVEEILSQTHIDLPNSIYGES